jgi:hypothetical protein
VLHETAIFNVVVAFMLSLAAAIPVGIYLSRSQTDLLPDRPQRSWAARSQANSWSMN